MCLYVREGKEREDRGRGTRLFEYRILLEEDGAEIGIGIGIDIDVDIGIGVGPFDTKLDESEGYKF